MDSNVPRCRAASLQKNLFAYNEFRIRKNIMAPVAQRLSSFLEAGTASCGSSMPWRKSFQNNSGIVKQSRLLHCLFQLPSRQLLSLTVLKRLQFHGTVLFCILAGCLFCYVFDGNSSRLRQKDAFSLSCARTRIIQYYPFWIPSILAQVALGNINCD